jgi:hypothetical protein
MEVTHLDGDVAEDLPDPWPSVKNNCPESISLLLCHRRWYKYPNWRNKMSSIFIINLVYPRDVNPGGVADDQKGGLDGYQSAG